MIGVLFIPFFNKENIHTPTKGGMLCNVQFQSSMLIYKALSCSIQTTKTR